MKRGCSSLAVTDVTTGVRPKIIAISGGKGGVGKTNVVVNLACLYASLNKKVLILDGDLGLGNVDVFVGIAPRYNLGDALMGKKTLSEIVVSGPLGIKIIPAGLGINAITKLNDKQQTKLTLEFESIKSNFDIIFIDTGPGINDNALFFCNISQATLIMVVGSEPASINAGYSLIKILSKHYGKQGFKILVNAVRSDKEAANAYRKLSIAIDKFIDIQLDYLGYLPFDQQVKRSIMAQKSVIERYPQSRFADKLIGIADKLIGINLNSEMIK